MTSIVIEKDKSVAYGRKHNNDRNVKVIEENDRNRTFRKLTWRHRLKCWKRKRQAQGNLRWYTMCRNRRRVPSKEDNNFVTRRKFSHPKWSNKSNEASQRTERKENSLALTDNNRKRTTGYGCRRAERERLQKNADSATHSNDEKLKAKQCVKLCQEQEHALWNTTVENKHDCQPTNHVGGMVRMHHEQGQKSLQVAVTNRQAMLHTTGKWTRLPSNKLWRQSQFWIQKRVDRLGSMSGYREGKART